VSIEPASKSGRQSVFVLVGEGEAFVVCHVLRVFLRQARSMCVVGRSVDLSGLFVV